jgi:Cd(II)/Pb(II)-responsive transcriptional regulator
MKIGELAKVTGTQIETIRFYEREGLLGTPERSIGNYRLYCETQTVRLSFIRRCRALDMNLDEIRTLLRFKDAPSEDCGKVNALLDEHIGHVSQRMRELRSLDRELRALRDLCGIGKDAANCGILNELSNAARSTAPLPPSHLAQVHGAQTKRRARAKQRVRLAR